MSTKLSLKSLSVPKKINSPLAKYNSVGQLFCVLCNVQIKNEMYWTGHINGKAHRDQVLFVKNKGATASIPQKRPASATSTSSSTASDGNGISSTSNVESSFVSKRWKLDDNESTSSTLSTMGPPTSTAVLKRPKPPPPRKKTFQEIEDEEARMEVDSSMVLTRPDSKDNELGEDEYNNDDETPETSASISTSSSATLPAGFFDDAKEDAKARGIEYKNPEEAEWDRFVKEIASEDVKSSVLRTVDEEYSAKDRELDEIEEQMKNWQRVLQLEKKAEEARKQQQDPELIKRHQNNLSDDEEEVDYDEDLDWRTKKY